MKLMNETYGISHSEFIRNLSKHFYRSAHSLGESSPKGKKLQVELF